MEKFKIVFHATLFVLLLSSTTCGFNSCEFHLCENGATCELDNNNNYNCLCKSGYEGKYCNIKTGLNPCKNGAIYEKIDDSFKCQCPHGWSGKYCEQNIDNCASKPCRNGGICKDLDNHKYECDCPEDYIGMNCDIRNPCANPHPCGLNGYCFSKDSTGFKCNCKKGFTGETCSVDVNECDVYESPLCENGGTCINTVGSYSCKCKIGFSGEKCEVDIVDCKNDTCKNGGVCIDKIGSYKCVCGNNFKGKNCEMRRSICETMPCKNGGYCRELANSFYCVCPNEYLGKTCEEEKNPCSINPCQNEGECHKISLEDFSCICKKGFNGKTCNIDIDDCANINCVNGGTCQDKVNKWQCNCLPGYSGDYCEINIDDCKDNPCRNSAECVDLINDYKCNCPPGLKGKNCEIKIDDCKDNPCRNSAQCVDLINDYKCNCPPGLKGKNCEINLDECATRPCLNNGRCENRIGGVTCQCLQGYAGLRCEIKSDDCDQQKPCKNGTICQNNFNDYQCVCSSNGSHCKNELSKCKNLQCTYGQGQCVVSFKEEKCVCSPGYSGLQCEREINECLNNPCQHGGECQDLINDYLCYCPNGYQGKDCEIVSNKCASNPCGSNGICIDERVGYRCKCNLPYSGPTCSTKLDPCKSNSCSNDAICIPGQDYKTYHCDCSTAIGRYEGFNCETDIDECALNYTQLVKYRLVLDTMVTSQIGPCVNENQCINTFGSYICKCSNRFEGQQCEFIVDNCRDNPCRNGAICQSLINGYQCKCVPGFSGDRCQIERNECENEPCRNGAKCINHINNYQCICPSGFSGKNCEINDNDCTESSCSNNGICIDQINNFTCICNDNFTGNNCEHRKRPCDSSPCQNNGSCINRKTMNDEPGYLCNCLRGYSGPRCEIKMDWCRGSPCGEHGKCIENIYSFKCICNYDYTGERCEIKKTETCSSYAKKKSGNGTLSNPICWHNGNCFNDPEVGGFKCSCQSGYGGSFCEVNIDDCAKQPCLNGGECKDGLGMYSCKCQPGFQGVDCQVNTNDCASEPCNHGKCIDQINNFTCICPRGISGRFCEITEDFCKKTVCENGGICRNRIGDFHCDCPKGFTGKYCDVDINECKYNMAGNLTNSFTNPKGPCSPTGTLECLDKPGHFLCVCKTGFTGKYCNIRIDYCEENRKLRKTPCFNSGFCRNIYSNKKNNNSTYECICPPGYGGNKCQLNTQKCKNNICKNGGICRPVDNGDKMSFKCECPPGVGGLYCEKDFVDECQSTICYSNGRCEDGFGKAICHCAKGYCGKNCEISGNACSFPVIRNSSTYNDELNHCHMKQCASKAGNKMCDIECNKLACGFDGGECLHRVPKRINGDDISMASPWSNCAIIKTDNIPCHNWFNNKHCDPQCNTEACLFDGWDCMESIGQCPNEPYCDKHYADGHCQLECSSMECGFDGGDCLKSTNSSIPGGIILLLPVSTTDFVSRWQTKLLQSLTYLLHSVVRIKRGDNGLPMIFSIRVFAETLNMANKIRQKRAINDINQQGKPGTKVYLEVDNRDCKIISKHCFDNSKSAAEFETAALHSYSYRPPVPILSVQTYHHPRKVFDEPPNGLVYVLVVMTCLVILGVLVGVLYGFMQNKAQGDEKTKKAETWYPEGMKRLNQPTSHFHHRRLGSSNRKRNQNLLNCHNASSELGNLQQMTKSKISTSDSIDDSGSNSLTSTRVTSYEININDKTNENVVVSENSMLLPNDDFNSNFPPEKRLKLHLDAYKELGDSRSIESWCFNTIVQLLVSGNGLGDFSSTESRDKQIIVEKLLQIAVNNQEEGKKFSDLSNKNDLSNNSLIIILTSRVPYSGETLLHLASKLNRKDATKFLLEAGSDPNKLENNGRSCLMTAIDAGALEVVSYLLEQQTFALDLHLKGPGGSTCLIQAVKEAHLEIIQLLLQHIQPEECDLNVTDDYGRTALHWAAITGQAGVVHLLLSYGLNRDAQDNEEATPLYLACKEGVIEVCKILIANGANPDISDHLDRLPRDIAKSNNFENIVALLEDYINVTKENQHRPLMWGQYNCYSNNYYCGSHPVDLKSVLYSAPSIQQMSCCVYPNSIQPDNIEFKSKNLGFYNPVMSLQNQATPPCFRSNQMNYCSQTPDSVKKRISSHTSPNLHNTESKMRYHLNNKRNHIKSPNILEYSSNNIDLPVVPPQVTNFYSCAGANNSFMALSGYNINSNNNQTSSTSAPGITPSPDSDSPGHWSTSSPSLSPRSKNQQHLLMQNAQTAPNGQLYKSSVLHYHPSHGTMFLGSNSAALQKNAIYRLHSRDNVCQY